MYILIEVREREIYHFEFDTFEEAVETMKSMVYETFDCESLEELDNNYIRNGNYDYWAENDCASAWANAHENYDWKIFKV